MAPSSPSPGAPRRANCTFCTWTHSNERNYVDSPSLNVNSSPGKKVIVNYRTGLENDVYSLSFGLIVHTGKCIKLTFLSSTRIIKELSNPVGVC